jgi:uncharacterized protein (TIGR02646 family)
MLTSGGDIDNPACHKKVVEKLHTMQHGKCCYCEKKIDTVGNEQAIEHIRPQAQNQFPQLKNEWANLLHACANCNGKKKNQFPVDASNNPLIINPSEPLIDPEDHFDFEVDDEEVSFGRIKAKSNFAQAEKTIEVIGLDLVARRHDRCSIYIDLYKAYIEIVRAQAEDEITKGQKIQAFEAMLGANSPYAAFARVFARKKNLDVRFKVSSAPGFPWTHI